MNTCDNCGAKGPKVAIGDACPVCGKLVGWPVPTASSTAKEAAAYDVEQTDDALRDAVGEIAERNYNTLMRRKRNAERASGIAPPAANDPEPDDGSLDDAKPDPVSQGHPPDDPPAQQASTGDTPQQ